MYTAEPDNSDDHDNRWAILDPDGDQIGVVQNRWQAECLLTHLNRG